MNQIQSAIDLCGGGESDWRMIGEAAVHVSVNPADGCRFVGPTIIRDGDFHGGTFRGGYFYGGHFRGGTFRGGYFYGGDFRGGYFRGGDFRGGTFHGGTFRGGYFYGGYFRGGDFRGGDFRGGLFNSTPLQIIGWSSRIVVKQGEGDDRIAIGDKCHSLEYWLATPSIPTDVLPPGLSREQFLHQLSVLCGWQALTAQNLVQPGEREIIID